MARLTQMVVDCRHPASLARFWAAALDDFEVLPYDADEIARLAELGATIREEFDDHTWMLDPEGNDFCVTERAERA